MIITKNTVFNIFLNLIFFQAVRREFNVFPTCVILSTPSFLEKKTVIESFFRDLEFIAVNNVIAV